MNSCFAGFLENDLVQDWIQTLLEDSTPLKKWKNRRIELTDALASRNRSGFVFLRSHEERSLFIRTFLTLPRDYQRSILLWVLGRSVHPWMPCRHCGRELESKRHIEQCKLGLSPVNGPSAIEFLLRQNSDFAV